MRHGGDISVFSSLFETTLKSQKSVYNIDYVPLDGIAESVTATTSPGVSEGFDGATDCVLHRD